jgi:hypothetical protein
MLHSRGRKFVRLDAEDSNIHDFAFSSQKFLAFPSTRYSAPHIIHVAFAMTSRATIDALRLQIGNIRCQSMDTRPFVPKVLLQHIFTPQTIAKAVAELNCAPEDRIDLQDAIQREGIVTFAILIWMRREDTVVAFRMRECLDIIALTQDSVVAIAPSFGLEFVREHSWHFRPHFFHKGDNLEIDERKVLPFLREVGQTEEGGFGAVSKVEVHHLLQDFYPGSVGALYRTRN